MAYSLFRAFSGDNFDNREDLLRAHDAFVSILSESYVCAVTVNRDIKQNPFSHIVKNKKSTGIIMRELFIRGASEINITTFGMPKIIPVEGVFSRVDFQRLDYMGIRYQKVDRKLIGEIDRRVNYLLADRR